LQKGVRVAPEEEEVDIRDPKDAKARKDDKELKDVWGSKVLLGLEVVGLEVGRKDHRVVSQES